MRPRSRELAARGHRFGPGSDQAVGNFKSHCGSERKDRGHHKKTAKRVDILFLFKYSKLRRRINTEEKTKVVAAVWWTEFIQFLAEQAFLLLDDLKNKMN